MRNAEDALWYRVSKVFLSEKVKMVTAVLLKFHLFLANITSDSTVYHYSYRILRTGLEK